MATYTNGIVVAGGGPALVGYVVQPGEYALATYYYSGVTGTPTNFTLLVDIYVGEGDTVSANLSLPAPGGTVVYLFQSAILFSNVS